MSRNALGKSNSRKYLLSDPRNEKSVQGRASKGKIAATKKNMASTQGAAVTKSFIMATKDLTSPKKPITTRGLGIKASVNEANMKHLASSILK